MTSKELYEKSSEIIQKKPLYLRFLSLPGLDQAQRRLERDKMKQILWPPRVFLGLDHIFQRHNKHRMSKQLILNLMHVEVVQDAVVGQRHTGFLAPTPHTAKPFADVPSA